MVPKNNLAVLVAAAKRKDNTAISALYEKTHQRIYFTALMIVKNEQDALDIMQETYISAIRKLGSLKNPEAFEEWLQAIARNKCRNFLKKHKELLVDEEQEYLFEEIKDLSEEFLPAEALESKELQEIILSSIKALPAKLSQTVLYYYFDDMTTTEIALEMSCPTSTVSRRLAAARNRIKKDLTEKRRLFTIMPLPILTQIFKQVIKENSVWTASAEQSAACLEGIITGVNLSTAATISAGAKKFFLTTTGKVATLGTSVIIVTTIAVVSFVSDQNSKSEPIETPLSTTFSESYPSDENSIITDPSEGVTVSKQTTHSEVSSNTQTPADSLPAVTEPPNTTGSAALETSPSSVTSPINTEPPAETSLTTPPEPLTRLNGVLIKKLNIFDEYGDRWSVMNGFDESDKIFSDRDFTFVSIPDFLINLERIQLACDSKFLQADVAKFTAGSDITVYIGMDIRAVRKGLPTWLESWNLAEFDAFLSNDVTFVFYTKDFAKGTEITLGTNGESSSVIMYTVFASLKN